MHSASPRWAARVLQGAVVVDGEFRAWSLPSFLSSKKPEILPYSGKSSRVSVLSVHIKVVKIFNNKKPAFYCSVALVSDKNVKVFLRVKKLEIYNKDTCITNA